MPFGLQPIHLIIVAVVALVVFGPKNLPELGRGLGKALREFREGTREMTESFREEVSPGGQAGIKPVSRAPMPVLNAPQGQIQAGMGNYCNQCGAPNPAGANFCNRCGSSIVAIVPEPTPMMAHEEDAAQIPAVEEGTGAGEPS